MSTFLIAFLIILLLLITVTSFYVSKNKRINELKVKTTFAAIGDELIKVEMSGNDAEFMIAQNFNILGEKLSKYKNAKTELSRIISENQGLDEKLRVFENFISDLNLITDIGKQITSCLTVNEIAVKLFNNINSSMVAEEVSILISKDGEKKYYNVIDGRISEIKNLPWCLDSNNILNWVFENNKEVFLDHASEDYAQYVYTAPKMQHGARAAIAAESAIAIPLASPRKMIGSVSVLSASANSFNHFHLEFIRSLCSYVSVALENAHLYGEVDIEKQKSENLLLNILPPEVVKELKENGKIEAKYFENVTVLFTDFVNFTSAGERMSPQGLVDELDACFRAFDEITSKYNIEKIKTVGDAYLAVAGLPVADPKHAENVVMAAIEINNYMYQRRAKISSNTFEVRIGAHSGSVIAGIVGVKKFAYDIWGDTVNTASRMEQNSEPGKINISQTTFELVKNHFECSFRGEITAKNKGKLKMYFVTGKAEK